MSSWEAWSKAATAALKDLVRHQGSAYISRDESYYICRDYSLHLVKKVTLKNIGTQDIHCLESGFKSQQGAALKDITFGITTSQPQRGLMSRWARQGPAEVMTAFALPMVTATEETPLKEVNFVIGLMPPLRARSQVELNMEWTWPEWWAPLRDFGRDELTINVERVTHSLNVTIGCDSSLLGARTPEFTISRDVPRSTDTKGDYVCWTWAYRKAQDGIYRFDVRFIKKVGNDS